MTASHLLARLEALRRRVVVIGFGIKVTVGALDSYRPEFAEEIPVVDAIYAIDDRRELDLTGEEVDEVAGIGLDAFDRGLTGADLEAVVAAAVDQVVASRGA